MTVPFNVKSQYSIQEAFLKISDYIVRAAELGHKYVVLTDNNTLSGVPEFLSEVKKWNKNNPNNKLKAIVGAELSLKNKNFQGQVLVYCKNETGWKNLLKIIASLTDGFCCLETFLKYQDNLIKIRISDCVIFPANLSDSFDKKDFIGDAIYYVDKDDLLYQQIITCSRYKLTLKDKDEIIEKDPVNKLFFEGNENYLKPPETYKFPQKILDSIQEFSIEKPPQIPTFKDIKDPNEYITQLCRDGWIKRGLNKKVRGNDRLKEIYLDRIKTQLEIFKKYNLASYMLIIRDCMLYCEKNGATAGLRGSASGSIVCYLIDISDIDPVCPDPSLPYHPDRELSFERFMNPGRLAQGNISLPDIDLDIAFSFREELINYVKQKYGNDKIGYIATFGTMDGRAAIKEVFRVLEPVGHHFEIANEITSHMIDKAKAQDELEDLKEEDDDYNIIDYNIDNVVKVQQFSKEFPKEFAIAKKIANTIRSRGRHAAGILIANESLENLVPIIKDPDLEMNIAMVEMKYIESMGVVKYDFLGLAAYQKMDTIIEMINNNLTESYIKDNGIKEN